MKSWRVIGSWTLKLVSLTCIALMAVVGTLVGMMFGALGVVGLTAALKWR